MKILMVASESRPFCKTGGLADVVYSLSKELASLGEDVSIILPYYDAISRQLPKSGLKKAASFKTHMSWRQQLVDVYSTVQDGINYYFIENQQYFERGKMVSIITSSKINNTLKEAIFTVILMMVKDLPSLRWRSKNSYSLKRCIQTSSTFMTGKLACFHVY